MVIGRKCACFYDEEGEGEVYDGSGKGEEEVCAGVAVAVRFEIQSGEGAFEDPKENQATNEYCGAIVRRNVIEERFHIREFIYGTMDVLNYGKFGE